MSREKLRYGLIGLGGICMAHEWGYREKTDRMQITAVCDINTTIAERRAKPYQAKVYTDYRQLIEDPEVEVVDITLPHTLHYTVAKYAIEHKKHVIIEKPLTINPEEGLDLIKRAEKSGVKFTVAENTRFVKAYLEVEKLIQEGVLGEPRFIRTFISGSEIPRLRNTESWKGRRDGTGGGALLDAGAHSFYLLKWLVGELDEVLAYQTKYVEVSQVEDGGIVVGRTKNNAFFSTEYSFIVEAPWNERLEYHGSLGSIIIDQLNNPPAIHFKGERDMAGTPLQVEYEPMRWKIISIADGIKDFVDAIWDDRSPKVNPMDAYYAIKVIERAYQSANLVHPLKV
jgi:predicted dehydrogenase